MARVCPVWAEKVDDEEEEEIIEEFKEMDMIETVLERPPVGRSPRRQLQYADIDVVAAPPQERTTIEVEDEGYGEEEYPPEEEYPSDEEYSEEEYPPEDWNIYVIHFSDGDNWSVDDTSTCLEILRDDLLPDVNMFCYGQVESPYGSGQFINDLKANFGEETENLITSEIKNKDAIYDSIKEFMGKGL